MYIPQVECVSLSTKFKVLKLQAVVLVHDLLKSQAVVLVRDLHSQKYLMVITLYHCMSTALTN